MVLYDPIKNLKFTTQLKQKSFKAQKAWKTTNFTNKKMLLAKHSSTTLHLYKYLFIWFFIQVQFAVFYKCFQGKQQKHDKLIGKTAVARKAFSIFEFKS